MNNVFVFLVCSPDDKTVCQNIGDKGIVIYIWFVKFVIVSFDISTSKREYKY